MAPPGPVGATATAAAESSPLPPRKVENTGAPVGDSRATNASIPLRSPPWNVGWKALSVGKFAEAVSPTT